MAKPDSVVFLGTPVAGDCVKIASVGPPVVLTGAGAPCGGGGGGPVITTHVDLTDPPQPLYLDGAGNLYTSVNPNFVELTASADSTNPAEDLGNSYVCFLTSTGDGVGYIELGRQAVDWIGQRHQIVFSNRVTAGDTIVLESGTNGAPVIYDQIGLPVTTVTFVTASNSGADASYCLLEAWDQAPGTTAAQWRIVRTNCAVV
jgi:hypothetical protein